MQKKDINTLIADTMWGAASDDDVKRLRQLLEDDPQLKAQYEQLASGKDLAARYRQYAAISSPSHQQAKTRRLGSRLLRMAAAIAAMVMLVGGAAWYRQYTRVEPPVISQQMKQVMQMGDESGRLESVLETATAGTPVGEYKQQLRDTFHVADEVVEELLAAKRMTTMSDREFWLTLSDGTVVHLNYNTHLIYPDRFSGDSRDVVLDGEAYFIVARDRRHPFVVHTPQGVATAYGTEFNVNTRANGTEVVLVKGRVGATPNGGDEHMMTPGKMCTLNSNGHCDTKEVDIEPYVAWNTGRFEFRSWSLERIMDVMGRWYDREVEFADNDTRLLQLSGTFSRYDIVHPTMEAIERVAGVRIVIKNDKFLISKQ